jgi:superfamily II DNA helicase RecQ
MLLCNICLVVVPLLGLRCDQVAKAQTPTFKIKYYHLDENGHEDQLAIQRHLMLWHFEGGVPFEPIYLCACHAALFSSG